ncbi:hypothetical protein B0H34DRAFT_680030 [Crassisporium funariophilum]|nr:hypothetical protein B0H34DRAFT_680030 [Crassisporium funariophilum]
MGQGGIFTITNSTQYDWTRTSIDSYQMNAWDGSFPSTVAAGTTASFYLEWSEGVFQTISDDGGNAVYKMEGSGHTFQFKARGAHNLSVFLRDFAVEITGSSDASRDTFSIPWKHDGNMHFVLWNNATTGKFRVWIG